MARKAIASAVLSLALVSAAFAFNPAGRWQGSIVGGDQTLGVRYTMVANGSTLTGTMELLDYSAEFPIENGTIRGDSIAFSVDFAGMASVKQRGRVAGDTLHLLSDFGDGNATASVFTRIR